MCIGQKIDDAENLHFNDLRIKNSKEVKILGTTHPTDLTSALEFDSESHCL